MVVYGIILSVNAEANHTDDKKLQNTLDKIFDRLDDYLSKYDDQE